MTFTQKKTRSQAKGIHEGANVRPFHPYWESDHAVAPWDRFASREVGWNFSHLNIIYFYNLSKYS